MPNPMASDFSKVEETLQGGPTPTEEPKFDMSKTPGNPKAAEEITPHDQMEKVDDAAETVAGIIEPLPAGMPENFLGKTGKGVCVACMVSAAEYGETATCGCQASCRVGPDDTKCGADSLAGHSNEQVSIPEQQWEARCSKGKQACVDLLGGEKAQVEKEIAACAESEEPSQVCLSGITNRWSGVQATYYCTQPHHFACSEFRKDVSGTHDKWECFTSKGACNRSKKSESGRGPGGMRKTGSKTHCVWCGVMR